MAFLTDLEKFRGTGENNAKGQSLEEFLAGYDAKKYDCPSNTVDMLVFRSEAAFRSGSQPLQLLMVKRSNHPSIGFWALPGGFVEIRENLNDAARRELQEETGVSGIPLIQLRTWGEVDRDPRWRVITTSYLAVVEGELPVKAGDDAADALWFQVALEEDSREKNVFQLILTQPERKLTLRAAVRREETRRGLLKDVQYQLLKSEGIANDHSSLIVDALLYLRSLT